MGMVIAFPFPFLICTIIPVFSFHLDHSPLMFISSAWQRCHIKEMLVVIGVASVSACALPMFAWSIGIPTQSAEHERTQTWKKFCFYVKSVQSANEMKIKSARLFRLVSGLFVCCCCCCLFVFFLLLLTCSYKDPSVSLC